MYTIAIAAVSKSGTPTSYSEHCSAVMAAAYSGNIDSDPNDLAIVGNSLSDACGYTWSHA
ncbi:hypothetical protein DPMN_152844 [Dreissena polymorpha]|uniref:Uncharacterized protein n=1 Tax=Dreissena polymorpha TaxID=45954 RepID=A0A9D4FI11_DREPO|nr:hypothetical protein DPMN_152844 [Dreissena polymorpha]